MNINQSIFYENIPVLIPNTPNSLALNGQQQSNFTTDNSSFNRPLNLDAKITLPYSNDTEYRANKIQTHYYSDISQNTPNNDQIRSVSSNLDAHYQQNLNRTLNINNQQRKPKFPHQRNQLPNSVNNTANYRGNTLSLNTCPTENSAQKYGSIDLQTENTPLSMTLNPGRNQINFGDQRPSNSVDNQPDNHQSILEISILTPQQINQNQHYPIQFSTPNGCGFTPKGLYSQPATTSTSHNPNQHHYSNMIPLTTMNLNSQQTIIYHQSPHLNQNQPQKQQQQQQHQQQQILTPFTQINHFPSQNFNSIYPVSHQTNSNNYQPRMYPLSSNSPINCIAAQSCSPVIRNNINLINKKELEIQNENINRPRMSFQHLQNEPKIDSQKIQIIRQEINSSSPNFQNQSSLEIEQEELSKGNFSEDSNLQPRSSIQGNYTRQSSTGGADVTSYNHSRANSSSKNESDIQLRLEQMQISINKALNQIKINSSQDEISIIGNGQTNNAKKVSERKKNSNHKNNFNILKQLNQSQGIVNLDNFLQKVSQEDKENINSSNRKKLTSRELELQDSLSEQIQLFQSDRKQIEILSLNENGISLQSTNCVDQKQNVQNVYTKTKVSQNLKFNDSTQCHDNSQNFMNSVNSTLELSELDNTLHGIGFASQGNSFSMNLSGIAPQIVEKLTGISYNHHKYMQNPSNQQGSEQQQKQMTQNNYDHSSYNRTSPDLKECSFLYSMNSAFMVNNINGAVQNQENNVSSLFPFQSTDNQMFNNEKFDQRGEMAQETPKLNLPSSQACVVVPQTNKPHQEIPNQPSKKILDQEFHLECTPNTSAVKNEDGIKNKFMETDQILQKSKIQYQTANLQTQQKEALIQIQGNLNLDLQDQASSTFRSEKNNDFNLEDQFGDKDYGENSEQIEKLLKDPNFYNGIEEYFKHMEKRDLEQLKHTDSDESRRKNDSSGNNIFEMKRMSFGQVSPTSEIPINQQNIVNKYNQIDDCLKTKQQEEGNQFKSKLLSLNPQSLSQEIENYIKTYSVSDQKDTRVSVFTSNSQNSSLQPLMSQSVKENSNHPIGKDQTFHLIDSQNRKAVPFENLSYQSSANQSVQSEIQFQTENHNPSKETKNSFTNKQLFHPVCGDSSRNQNSDPHYQKPPLSNHAQDKRDQRKHGQNSNTQLANSNRKADMMQNGMSSTGTIPDIAYCVNKFINDEIGHNFSSGMNTENWHQSSASNNFASLSLNSDNISLVNRKIEANNLGCKLKADSLIQSSVDDSEKRRMMYFSNHYESDDQRQSPKQIGSLRNNSSDLQLTPTDGNVMSFSQNLLTSQSYILAQEDIAQLQSMGLSYISRFRKNVPASNFNSSTANQNNNINNSNVGNNFKKNQIQNRFCTQGSEHEDNHFLMDNYHETNKKEERNNRFNTTGNIQNNLLYQDVNTMETVQFSDEQEIYFKLDVQNGKMIPVQINKILQLNTLEDAASNKFKPQFSSKYFSKTAKNQNTPTSSSSKQSFQLNANQQLNHQRSQSFNTEVLNATTQVNQNDQNSPKTISTASDRTWQKTLLQANIKQLAQEFQINQITKDQQNYEQQLDDIQVAWDLIISAFQEQEQQQKQISKLQQDYQIMLAEIQHPKSKGRQNSFDFSRIQNLNGSSGQFNHQRSISQNSQPASQFKNHYFPLNESPSEQTKSGSVYQKFNNYLSSQISLRDNSNFQPQAKSVYADTLQKYSQKLATELSQKITRSLSQQQIPNQQKK